MHARTQVVGSCRLDKGNHERRGGGESKKIVKFGTKGDTYWRYSIYDRVKAMDISYNKELTGQIPSSIGSLSKLENLVESEDECCVFLGIYLITN
ncbi:hypothetical protein J5N97_003526 [Dioscorea zingiberensis]|uniref:Uncharacterized protein n=1 Tax=Dioscorea zingiberensis TaxID=325984 RepID=A0A9D5HQ59_9LILI|nr:hypothetical protein J5N97_003526 [Dioscorea zingiberensis]